ncbi:NADPH:quinone reductase, partial [Staphylococcus caprae]
GIVSTEEKRRLALDLGYDEVWLRDELADKSGRQFDVIIDPVSGRDRPELLKLLRFEGRLIVVGNAAQDGDQTVGTNTF